MSRKADDSFLLLGIFSNLGLSKTWRKAVGNRWGLAWPSIGNHRQYNQRNCRSWRLQSSRGTKTTVRMLEVMDGDTIRLWLAYYVTVLTSGDVSWYECSEWFWWYLVWLVPKCMLIAVLIWQDHCYLMRRKELATELEQQGITASRMTALEIQDFMCCNGWKKILRFASSLTSVPIIFTKRCRTHIAYTLYVNKMILWTNILSIHDYRHIRNTFFWSYSIQKVL